MCGVTLNRCNMVVIIVQEDGRIALPDAVRERMGLRPGTRLALEETTGSQALELHVIPDDVQLVEKEGVWVLRQRAQVACVSEDDPVSQHREERLASLADPK